MYICTHVRLYACSYACLFVCMFVHMYVFIHLCTYVCMYVCICTYMFVSKFACMHVGHIHLCDHESPRLRLCVLQMSTRVRHGMPVFIIYMNVLLLQAQQARHVSSTVTRSSVTSTRSGRSVTTPMLSRHHLQQQKHGVAHIFTDIKTDSLHVDVDALSTLFLVRRLKGPTHSGHLLE